MADEVVLYDRDCGFCRWTLAKLLAWDRGGALRPVAIQDPEAAEFLEGLAEDERLASWHLSADGRVRSGGAAFAPVLRLLPGGRAPAAIAGRFPGAADRAYRLVAGNRSRLGRLVTSGARSRADRRIASRASSSRGPS
jgi:predicted DCC family thiol-disulfide oxidoreductase YuxK